MDIINQTLDFLSDNSVRIISALLVLIVGVIIAFVLAKVVRELLRRTNIDNRLASLSDGDQNSSPPKVENALSQALFYLLILASIVGFFSTLGVPQVTDPLNRFLDTVFDYLPNIAGAIVLTVIAVFLARLVKAIVSRLAKSFNIDDRFKSTTATITEKVQNDNAQDEDISTGAQKTNQTIMQTSISDVIANTFYYLVILIFLPGILGTLNLGGILEPVQNVVADVVGFLPNLFAAILILIVGYYVAKIVKGFVESFSRTVGLDALGNRVGMSTLAGQNLSSLAGLTVFILILLPVIVSALSALKIDAITQPARDIVTSIIAALPNLAGAVLIVLIGYVAGRVIADLARSFLAGVGFDTLPSKLGLAQVQDKVNNSAITLSQIAGNIILVYILVLVSTQALNIIGLTQITDLLNQFLSLSGKVLIATLIFGFGLFLGGFTYNSIKNSNMNYSNALANAARIGIVTVSIFMALEQSGVATNIVSYGFIIILGSIGIALALALGLGGQDAARDVLNRLKDRTMPPSQA